MESTQSDKIQLIGDEPNQDKPITSSSSQKFSPELIFDRQIRIQGWKQEKLSTEVALCLGIGGLGSCVTMNLCRLGIKKLIIIDYDVVDVHNLNRQILFGPNDIGISKVEAAKKNLGVHNVGNTEIIAYHMDVIANWTKIIELAKESTVVFNMIDYGDHFDIALQSLCLKLQLPLIMGGTFATSLTCDLFDRKGKACLLCLTDDIKNSIIEQIHPNIIMNHQDLKFLPKNNNPIGQSSVFLCLTCANFMVSLYINQLFGDPDVQHIHRILFYVNTFESVIFPVEPKPDCPFCSEPKPKVKKASKLKKEKTLKKHDAEFFPQRNVFEFDDLVFDSKFESGNLKRVEKAEANHYDLWIAQDNLETEYQTWHRVWYFFKIRDLKFKEDENIKTVYFTLKNISNNQIENYKGGMVPVYLSKPTMNKWEYIPSPQTKFIRQDKVLESGFKFDFTREHQETWFCFTFPYNYTDIIKNFAEMEVKYRDDKDIYIHREHLINSIEDRRLDLITITGQDQDYLNGFKDFEVEELIPNLFPGFVPSSDKPTYATRHNYRPIKFKNKQYCLFTCRVHPAESPANYMLDGFVNNLLNKDDPVSKLLLEKFVFVIVPILNPDGVYRGHYRCDTKGRDLNRFYHVVDPKETPGPYASIELAKYLSKDHRLFMFIDFHAHSNEDAGFVFANHDEKEESRMNIRLFAKLLDIYSNHFDYQSCNFGSLAQLENPDPNKRGVAKSEIKKVSGVYHTYTLETSYHRGTKDPSRYIKDLNKIFDLNIPIEMKSKKYILNIDHYIEIGDSIRHALLDLIGLHPNTKLTQTLYEKIENLKNEILNNINK